MRKISLMGACLILGTLALADGGCSEDTDQTTGTGSGATTGTASTGGSAGSTSSGTGGTGVGGGAGATGGSGQGGQTTGGSGTGGAGPCDAEPGDDACDSCVKTQCCSQLEICAGNADCMCFTDCMKTSPEGGYCITQCGLNSVPDGAIDVIQCMQQHCDQDCGP